MRPGRCKVFYKDVRCSYDSYREKARKSSINGENHPLFPSLQRRGIRGGKKFISLPLFIENLQKTLNP
jgi:hypothetical protein